MIKNLPASVRDRLTRKAKEAHRPFQELLQYFAMERFLYRLSQSPHADQFVLKGALMFTAWAASASRPTKDIDLLSRMDNTVEAVVKVITEVCHVSVEPDGLDFDATTVSGNVIKEEAEYPGVRVTFVCRLQTARVPMQIDMGFGDVVSPSAVRTDFPVLLDFAIPRLLGYPRETVVAEKFEAMTKLSMLNSRLKDFYDLWLLSRLFNFDGITLATAIRKTFENRNTAVNANPTALSATFGSNADKQKQWLGLLKRSHLTQAPSSLQNVVDALVPFLYPVAAAIEKKMIFREQWTAPGPWSPKTS